VHLEEVYGAEVSKQTITAITDHVMEGLADWQSRPLDAVYAMIFTGAINVKIRDGQVAGRPVYVVLGVTAGGERDILGLCAAEHGDGKGVRYWLRVCPEIKNRGTRDVLMVVCDGLKAPPDAVNSVWEKTIVQTCIVHYAGITSISCGIRSKYAWKRDRAQLAKDLRPVYTAAFEAEALDRFAEFSGRGRAGHRDPGAASWLPARPAAGPGRNHDDGGRAGVSGPWRRPWANPLGGITHDYQHRAPAAALTHPWSFAKIPHLSGVTHGFTSSTARDGCLARL
jgi:transposase-like protein